MPRFMLSRVLCAAGRVARHSRAHRRPAQEAHRRGAQGTGREVGGTEHGGDQGVPGRQVSRSDQGVRGVPGDRPPVVPEGRVPRRPRQPRHVDEQPGGPVPVQGKLADAEPLFKDALEMRKRLFKGDHPDVAHSLNNLALLYQARGSWRTPSRCSRTPWRCASGCSRATTPTWPQPEQPRDSVPGSGEVGGRRAAAQGRPGDVQAAVQGRPPRRGQSA